MIIENIAPFGHFKPGDPLTIPDGSIFDHAYWVHVVEVTHTVMHDEPVTETVPGPAVTEVVNEQVPETVTELEPVTGE